MIRFDQHRAPVEVVQFIADSDGRCSYIIGCGQTRVAALVDPDPDFAEAYAEELEASGLRLRMVLDTMDRCEGPEPLWEGVPRVGPLGRTRVLEAGECELQLREEGELVADVAYTVFGSRFPPNPEQPYGPVRVAFGPFHVEVMPLADHPGRVAYHLADRLFTGTELRASGTEHLSTPVELLGLPSHVIVYPGWAGDRVSLSIVAAERRAMHRAPPTLRNHPNREDTHPPAFVEELEVIEDFEPLDDEPPTEEAPRLPEVPEDYWAALDMGRTFVGEHKYALAVLAFEAALGFRPGESIAGQNLRRARELAAAEVR